MCVYRDVRIGMYKVLLKILGDLHLRRIPCQFASIISLGLCMLCYVPRCPPQRGNKTLYAVGKKRKKRIFVHICLYFLLAVPSSGSLASGEKDLVLKSERNILISVINTKGNTLTETKASLIQKSNSLHNCTLSRHSS